MGNTIWTPAKERYLRIYYSDESIDINKISETLELSINAIHVKAHLLNIKRRKKIILSDNDKWTSCRNELLILLYSDKKTSLSSISNQLSTKNNILTINDIKCRASKLNLLRSRSVFDDFLLKYYKTRIYDTKFISEKFGVSVKFIYKRASKIGATQKQLFVMTTKKLSAIKDRFSDCTTNELALELEIPEYMINKTARQLKLNKNYKPKKSYKRQVLKIKPRWTMEEELFIKENYYKMTSIDLGAKLFRTSRSVTSKLIHMGLRKESLKIYSRGSVRFTYITEDEKRRKCEYVTMYRNLLNKCEKRNDYVIRKVKPINIKTKNGFSC